MAEQELSELTPHEEEVLRREMLLERVGRLYASKHEKPKPWWITFINSSVAATIITVVIGGIAGQTMLSVFQYRQKQAELAQEQFRQYIQRQQEVIQQSIELLGSVEFDAEVLLQLAQRRADPAYAENPSERKKMSEKRDKLLEAHIDAIRKWNTGHRQMALLLTYYNFGQPSIKTAWENTDNAATNLLNCAETVLEDYEKNPGMPPKSCYDKRVILDNNLTQLSQVFEQVRQYSWQTVSAPKGARSF